MTDPEFWNRGRRSEVWREGCAPSPEKFLKFHAEQIMRTHAKILLGYNMLPLNPPLH